MAHQGSDVWAVGSLRIPKSEKYALVLDIAQLTDVFFMKFLREPRLRGGIFSFPPELYMWMHGTREREHGRTAFSVKRIDTPHIQKYDTIMSAEEFQATSEVPLPRKARGLEVIGGIHNHPLERGDPLENVFPLVSGDCTCYTRDMRKLRRDGFSGIHVITRVDAAMLLHPLKRQDWIVGNTVAWTWEYTERELAARDRPSKMFWVPIRYENLDTSRWND